MEESILDRLTRLSKRGGLWKRKLPNFVPIGVIQSATDIRKDRLKTASNATTMQLSTLEKDLSYAWQLVEFYDWFFENVRTDLVVNTWLIRQAVILVGSVAESLCIYDLLHLKLHGIVQRSVKKMKFKTAIDTLRDLGIIDNDLQDSLNDLRNLRNQVHIQLGTGINKDILTENNYFEQRLVLEKLSMCRNKFWGS